MGAVSNCNRYACLGVVGSVQSGQADQKDDCGRDDKPGVDFTFFVFQNYERVVINVMSMPASFRIEYADRIPAAMPMTIACFFHVSRRYPANSRSRAFNVKYHFVFAPKPIHLIPCCLARSKARNTW